MTLRFEALDAVRRNPGATLDELDEMLSSGVKGRQAVLDARKAGMLSTKLDEVTRQPGYHLTDAGKKRLAEGPASRQGSNLPSAKKPRLAVTAEPESSEDGDEMPPADPALLASANRMLSERLEEAKTMICNAAETLTPYVGGEIDSSDMDLHEIAEAVALNVVELMAKLSNAQSLAEVLKRNFESKERECEALRKRAEAANERAAEKPVFGYITDDLDEIHLTIEGVRESAEFATIQSGLEMNVYELRFVGMSKRSAEWVPA